MGKNMRIEDLQLVNYTKIAEKLGTTYPTVKLNLEGKRETRPTVLGQKIKAMAKRVIKAYEIIED